MLNIMERIWMFQLFILLLLQAAFLWLPKRSGLRKYPGWEDGRRSEMRAVCWPHRACFWISDQKLQPRPPLNHGLQNICCHIALNYLFVDPAECMYPSLLLSRVRLRVCVCVFLETEMFNEQQQQNDPLVCGIPGWLRWSWMEYTHRTTVVCSFPTAGSRIPDILAAAKTLLLFPTPTHSLSVRSH